MATAGFPDLESLPREQLLAVAHEYMLSGMLGAPGGSPSLMGAGIEPDKLWINPDCGFCRELAPKLAALARHADTLSHPIGEGRGEGVPLPLIITTGDAEANRKFFAEHNINCPVLLQKDGKFAKAYQAHGTPSGYLISAERKIASELAMGAEALLALAVGKSEVRSPNWSKI